MKKRREIIRLLLLGTAICAGTGFAYWVPLPPVGNGEVVGPGGCAARGRGYTFVAIGNDDDLIFPFEHVTETWDENFEPIPDYIEGAGAMAYEFWYGGRLFVAVRVEDEYDRLHIYEFDNAIGLDGRWR
ncbi:MAG: hypothetical protein ACP5PK_08005, partial [candidate division WOR-3 bacterium]